VPPKYSYWFNHSNSVSKWSQKNNCDTVDSTSGVFRIWKRGGAMASARVYKGGWGRAPAGSRGRVPGRGLLLNVQWKLQIRPFFENLETQKTIKHCWIWQFLLENGKNCTFSYKFACKKFPWSGQRGGHRTVAPPKYATDSTYYIMQSKTRYCEVTTYSNWPNI